MKKNFKHAKTFIAGIIVENPVLVGLLGMCPTLATTKSVEAALGMGILVILTLLGSNLLVSILRNIIPAEVKIPCYIVIIATFVSVIEMLCQALVPALFETLGVFISLIVVNCIVLGRAEAFASKNTVLESFFDALSMGFGFLFAICSIALVREFFGTSGLVFTNPFTGKEIFSFVIAEGKYAIGLLTKPSGAFLIFGLLTAAVNAISISKANKQKEKELAAKKAAAQAK